MGYLYSVDRAVAKLIVEAALIAAERPPGESIGVFMPVPPDLGFPSAGEHDDDPHITVLFIGAVPNGQRDVLIKKVQEVVGGHPPLEMKIDSAVSYFPPTENSDHKRVAKLGVSAEGLEDLHKEIWEQVEAAGIEVEHSFPDFKPHVTLDYIEPGTSYAGDAPIGGSWTANSMEIWGWGDPVEVSF
jgi:2'-5' RNA ligase